MTAGPLTYARRYADLGLHSFPCAVIKRDGKNVKMPMVKDWPNVASVDHAQLAEWWRRWPAAMVGLAHRRTGTVALDIDTHHGKDGALTLIRRMIAGDRETATPAFRTASGGAQRIYARPVDLAAASGNYVDALGEGLDVIAGYSILPSGTATPGRDWTIGNTPADLFPAACPEWIIQPLREKADMDAAVALLPRPAPPPLGSDDALGYVGRAVDWAVEDIRALPKGELQDGLKRIACRAGAACARANAPELAGWVEDCLTGAAGWTNTAHERRTIRTGIAWGIQNG